MALAGGARNWTPLDAPARPAAGGPRGGEPPAARRPTDAPSLWVPDCARGVPRPARGSGHSSGSGGGWQQRSPPVGPPACRRRRPPAREAGSRRGVGAGAPSSRVLHFSGDRGGGHSGSPRAKKTQHSATRRITKRGGGGGGGGGYTGRCGGWVGGEYARGGMDNKEDKQRPPRGTRPFTTNGGE